MQQLHVVAFNKRKNATCTHSSRVLLLAQRLYRGPVRKLFSAPHREKKSLIFFLLLMFNGEKPKQSHQTLKNMIGLVSYIRTPGQEVAVRS
jgi:hypothetical protein